MHFTTISDVHIKYPGDKATELFLDFLRSEEVSQSDKIFLLGDIFDLMIGNHKQYFEDHKEIFAELKSLLMKGKEIIYFEGNHDFHLTTLFNDFCKINGLGDRFKFIKTFWFEEINNQQMIFCHGDDIELGNISYKLYKRFINNRFMSLIADDLFPYSLIKFIGDRASKASRERNNERYSDNNNSSELKDKFRAASEKLRVQYEFDVLICGHSHIKDEYVSKNNFKYLNNGYLKATKSFIYYDGKEFNFIPLPNG